MEAATARHFMFHGRKDGVSQVSADEIRSCHWCQIRSFATHATLPVTVVNETDDGAVLPPRFRFISRSVFGPGVKPAEASFRSGCECGDDEECMYDSCLCLEEAVGDSDSDTDRDELDNSSADELARRRRRRTRFAYHAHGVKGGLLRRKILHSREPIYECHEGCGCSKRCPNRVVERGRTVPLQIFRTTNRGWGVRAMADIRRGQFVDCYLGEIITAKEADRRRASSDIARHKDVYLFALDKFTDAASPDPRLVGPPLEVDGEYMSGPTRFINHSCEPNMRIFARVGDHADKHVHDLALFAVRDIPKGEELTFDYVDGLEGMRSDANDPSKQEDMTVCLCGTAKCKGYLW